MKLIIAGRIESIVESLQKSLQNRPKKEQFELLAKCLGKDARANAIPFLVLRNWMDKNFKKYWSESSLSKEDVQMLVIDGWETLPKIDPIEGDWWCVYLKKNIRRFIARIDMKVQGLPKPEVEIKDNKASVRLDPEYRTYADVLNSIKDAWEGTFNKAGTETWIIDKGKTDIVLRVEVEKKQLPSVGDIVFIPTPKRMKDLGVTLDIEGKVSKVENDGTVWVESKQYKRGQPFAMLAGELHTYTLSEDFYDDEEEEIISVDEVQDLLEDAEEYLDEDEPSDDIDVDLHDDYIEEEIYRLEEEIEGDDFGFGDVPFETKNIIEFLVAGKLRQYDDA